MAPMALTPSPNEIVYQLEHKSDDRGPEIQRALIIVFIISTITVVLRFWARKMTRAAIWWDDILMVFTWLMNLAVFAIYIKAVKIGLGKHAVVVGRMRVRKFLLAGYAFYIFFPFLVCSLRNQLILDSMLMAVIQIGGSRFSILVFYLRIFTIRKFKRITWAIIVFSILWTLAVRLLSHVQSQLAKSSNA